MTTRYRHRRITDPAQPFPGTVEPGEIVLNTANRQLAAGDAATDSPGVPLSLLAVRIFDVRGQYAPGDYVVNAGQLYHCVVPHGPAPFHEPNFEALLTSSLIDDKLEFYLPLIGGTLNGALHLPIEPPTLDTQAANKKYVDDKVGTYVPPVGGGAGAAADITNTPAGGVSATNVQAAINELDTEKAPLSSPTFTDTPAAPTPPVGDSSTRIATTAFVAGQASNADPLQDGTVAQGTSLRFARQDHVHPTDTTRAPLNSPAFINTPTAPTAPPGTNTTQIATTAFAIANASALADGAVTYAKVASTAIATRAEFLANTANKLLNVATAWAAGQTTVMTDAATVAPDLAAGVDFIWTIGASGRTVGTPQSISVKVGQKGMIYIVQGGAGSNTIASWASAYKFPGGTKPILSTTVGAVDCLSYAVKSTGEVHCFFARDMK